MSFLSGGSLTLSGVSSFICLRARRPALGSCTCDSLQRGVRQCLAGDAEREDLERRPARFLHRLFEFSEPFSTSGTAKASGLALDGFSVSAEGNKVWFDDKCSSLSDGLSLKNNIKITIILYCLKVGERL